MGSTPEGDCSADLAHGFAVERGHRCARLSSSMPSIRRAASSLGVELSVAPVQKADEIEAVIASQARKPGGGVS